MKKGIGIIYYWGVKQLFIVSIGVNYQVTLNGVKVSLTVYCWQ